MVGWWRDVGGVFWVVGGFFQVGRMRGLEGEIGW